MAQTFQLVMPQNLPAVRVQTEQMPVRTRKNFSVMIQHRHIRITGRGEKSRLQFRSPNFGSGSDFNRCHVAVAPDIQMLCHARIVPTPSRRGDYKTRNPLQFVSFHPLLSSSQRSQPLPSIDQLNRVVMIKRMSNLVRGLLGLFISGIERENPEALLEVEKENLRKQIAQYNQGLAGHAALCERLMSQIKRQELEERDLSAKTMAHLKSTNQEAAAQYALRLQNLRQELDENRAQAKSAEATYQELLRAREYAVKAAQQKIEALKFSIDDMKIKKATAELTEMASGMISQLGGSGDTLNRLQGIVQEEQEKAAGRARVARDSMNMPDIAMKEAEQKALANQALAEFAAQAGIALEPMSAAAASSPAAATQTSPQTSTPAQTQPAGKETLGPTPIKN